MLFSDLLLAAAADAVPFVPPLSTGCVRPVRGRKFWSDPFHGLHAVGFPLPFSKIERSRR